MSSIISTSNGVVLATAMAVSGTVILLALRRQKPQPPSSRHALRSCLSSDERRSEKKMKKRVRFAEDVVGPAGDSEILRKRGGGNGELSSSPAPELENGGRKVRGMPANRLALYSGMLRDRGAHRVAYFC